MTTSTGGGVLADFSMRAVTATFAAAPSTCAGPHRVCTHDGHRQVRCAHPARARTVVRPRYIPHAQRAHAFRGPAVPGGVAC